MKRSIRNYVLGILTGAVIAGIAWGIPAFANGAEVLFNTVRLNANGYDRAQWGESYKLSDGTEVPYSLEYNGTTYLPLRKIGEFTGNRVLWNGDSQTVTVIPAYDYKDEKVLATEPDANGNIWRYSVVHETGNPKNRYLLIEDRKRDFARAYAVAGSDSTDAAVRVEEDGILAVRVQGLASGWGREMYVMDLEMDIGLYKIPFASDADSQDGILVERFGEKNIREFIWTGDYVFGHSRTTGTLSQSVIYAFNLAEKRENHVLMGAWTRIAGLKLVYEDEEKAVFHYIYSPNLAPEYECGIDMSKKDLSFGERYKITKEVVGGERD